MSKQAPTHARTPGGCWEEPPKQKHTIFLLMSRTTCYRKASMRTHLRLAAAVKERCCRRAHETLRNPLLRHVRFVEHTLACARTWWRPCMSPKETPSIPPSISQLKIQNHIKRRTHLAAAVKARHPPCPALLPQSPPLAAAPASPRSVITTTDHAGSRSGTVIQDTAKVTICVHKGKGMGRGAAWQSSGKKPTEPHGFDAPTMLRHCDYTRPGHAMHAWLLRCWCKHSLQPGRGCLLRRLVATHAT